MPRKASEEKTLMDQMVEINPFASWGKTLGQEGATNKAATAMAETMREMVMGQMMLDMSDRIEDGRHRRRIERERETQKAAEGPQGKVDAMSVFMKGFSDPNWLDKWTQMAPEDQDRLMGIVSNYSMMSPMQAGVMNPMMYQLMLAQQQRPGDQIKVQDLVSMFTSGMKEAMTLAQGAQTNQQSLPEMISAVSKIMEPVTQKANASDQKMWDVVMKQLETQKTGGLEETIGVIQKVAETFGGGGANQADIEINRLQAQSAFQMAQLQADMQMRAEEMRAESNKWEQIGGLAMTGLGAVAPMVGQSFRQMGQQAAHQAGPQAHPDKTMPPMQAGLPGAPGGQYAEIKCGECNHSFQVGLQGNGQLPPRIKCPSCGEILEAEE